MSEEIEKLEKILLCAGAAYFRLHSEIRRMQLAVKNKEFSYIKTASQSFNDGVLRTLEETDSEMHELYSNMKKIFDMIPNIDELIRKIKDSSEVVSL
ncbi:MAG TPA: hypothetical protein VEP90_18425 [Methylomirabilota bacterium]|nr:hypothetical protein [Methylomirabilota bacterium]